MGTAGIYAVNFSLADVLTPLFFFFNFSTLGAAPPPPPPPPTPTPGTPPILPTTSVKGIPLVPVVMTNDTEHRRQLAQGINLALTGKMNVTLDVTLAANAAMTTIHDPRIGFFSAITPAMPLTANGATALAAGIWVDTMKKGSAVVHHASSANTDQTIRFVILG